MVPRGIILAAALMCGPALYAQNVTRLDAVGGVPDIDRTTQSQDVRFRDARGDRMTVPVRLGGVGPYQFLVDTGADRSAVSSAIVARLALAPAGSVSLHSSTGVTTVSTARVPSLEFTRPAHKLIEAAVLESANMGADGIVGADVLRSQRVQFDFENKTMTIVPAAVPDFRTEPGTIVVEARRKNGRLILTDAVANGQTVTVVLDTGSEVCVGNEALRQRLLGRNLVDGRETVQLQSVTGDMIAGDYMFVRKLQLGGITLEYLAVVFVDAHTFKQLKLDKTPALLLGMNAFRAFKKVSIDFANRQFRVVLPEHSQVDVRLALRGRS
ncbi:MAG: retroviral-like aspartic protease family protein [Sphingomicrobium sp.]